MDLDGDGERLGEGGDEAAGCQRGEDAGHVLDADGLGAHLLLLLRDLDEEVEGVDGAGGVADRALGVAAVLLDGADGHLEVAVVVEGVEDAEDVHAVLDGEGDEALEDIVGVVLVAEDVLAAQEHLERGLLRVGLDEAQALPGIFAEEAQADVERGAAPALQGVEADGVDGVDDLQDV